MVRDRIEFGKEDGRIGDLARGRNLWSVDWSRVGSFVSLNYGSKGKIFRSEELILVVVDLQASHSTLPRTDCY